MPREGPPEKLYIGSCRCANGVLTVSRTQRRYAVCSFAGRSFHLFSLTCFSSFCDTRLWTVALVETLMTNNYKMTQLLKAHAGKLDVFDASQIPRGLPEDVESTLMRIVENRNHAEFYILCFMLTGSDASYRAMSDCLWIPDAISDWRDDRRNELVSPSERDAIAELAYTLEDANKPAATPREKKQARENLSKFLCNRSHSNPRSITLLYNILMSTPELWDDYYDFFTHSSKVSEDERTRIKHALLVLRIDGATMSIDDADSYVHLICSDFSPGARALLRAIYEFQELHVYGDVYSACGRDLFSKFSGNSYGLSRRPKKH